MKNNTIPSVLSLAKQLIERPSVTPEDGGCQKLLGTLLESRGFTCRALPFGEVSNLWATHGESGPLLCLVGHTDVVPPGDETLWRFPPFSPTEHEGYLYGRGAQDMKGPLAALVVAALRFIDAHPQHKGRLAFLVTSDEEGPSIDGTAKVLETLLQEGETIRWCLVGEPSCQKTLGDTVKRGSRGSLSGRLRINGIQGHVAHPENARNAIHHALPLLQALQALSFKPDHPEFPETQLQMVYIHGGTGAPNVIPGALEVHFNLRYHPHTPKEALQQEILALLKASALDHQITWHGTGGPFFTESGALLEAAKKAIEQHCSTTPNFSTKGGTSDGRFFTPLGAEVIELGCCHDTIHQVNERVQISELEPLAALYQAILTELLT